VARMEQSSTVLTHSLALSLQERWWPAGGPQREVVRAKRRRLDYLMTMSSRLWLVRSGPSRLVTPMRRSGLLM
jgi:hypothetical protein